MLQRISKREAKRLHANGIFVYIAFPWRPVLEVESPYQLLNPMGNFEEEVLFWTGNFPIVTHIYRSNYRPEFFADSVDLDKHKQLSIDDLFA